MTEQHETRSGVSGLSGRHKDIPQATVARLALYLRVLGVLLDAGTLIVSSEELASAAGVGSAKLRKDLSFLGPNGVRGVGYDVARLLARIEGALGLEHGHRMVIVGAGNLGRALAGYGGFSRRGFTLVGLFDVDETLVGSTVPAHAPGLVVRHVADLGHALAELDATVAVITVPDEAAQPICDLLVDAGLRCLLNFTSVALDAPSHVAVRHVDLAVEMQLLSFDSARIADDSGEDQGSVVGQ